MYLEGSADTRFSFFVARKTPHPKNKRRTLASRAVALLLGVSFAALSSGAALASTDTWNGGSSVNWSDTGNWSTGAIPASGQDVVIQPSGTTPFAPNNLDGSYTLNSLTLGTTTNGSTVTNGYDITTSNSSTLSFDSGGFVRDISGNIGTDQINVGVTFNGTGTISASNSSSLAFGQAVNLNGAMAINVAAGSNLTFDQGLTGTGGVTITNTNVGGGLIFLGASNYSGGTTISSGTLQLGNGTTSGSITGDVTIASGAGLTFFDPAASTPAFSGNISNSGTITQLGTGSLTISGAISGSGTVAVDNGTLVLTGANTYTGLTTVVASSTLQIGDGTTLGTTFAGGISTSSGSQVVFDAASDGITYSNATQGISGAGSLVVEGGNTLILTGNAFQSGGTTIQNNTTLQLGNGGATGGLAPGGAIAIDDTSTLAVDESGAVILTGALSGTGTLKQMGTGTTYIEGLNTSYTGTPDIEGGTLELGFAGNQGTLASTNITDNATLEFNEPSTTTVSALIAGSGQLIQAGTGTVILTNSNTYSGGTTINSGATLQLGGGGVAGTIAGDVTDNGTFSFNTLPSSSYTFGGAITGTGIVDVNVGSGNSVTLSNTGNTYSGGTNIDSGTLVVGAHTNIGTGTIAFTSATANGAAVNFTGTDTYSNPVTLAAGGGTFDANNTVTLSGPISGTGGATFATGTFILTNTETYAGGTTVGNASALVLGNGTAAGMVAGNIGLGNSGELLFDEPGATTFAGNISGGANAVVVQEGPGTLTLSGTNTFGGSLNVQTTVAVSSNSNLGTGVVHLSDGATLDLTASNTFTDGLVINSGKAAVAVTSGSTATWSGTIGGGGTLQVSGGGTLALTNPLNDYHGTVVFGNSTLSVDQDAELGASTGAVQLGDSASNTGGSLDVTQSFTLGSGRAVSVAGSGGTIKTESGVTFEIANGISGSGALTVGGPGTFVLAGTSTYTGNTNISTGATLQLGDGTNAGALAAGGTVNDAGALIFNEGGNASFSNAITGAGSVTQNDTAGGTLTLTGANSYTGGTTITSGALQLGDGTNAGTVSGNIADNSALVFDEPSNTTYSGIISGTGTVEVSGTNTLTLSGNNTYSGQTTIDSGATLQVGVGSASGSISDSSAIVNNGTLVIDTTGTTVLTGGISGNGNISLLGSGTTEFTGNSTGNGTITVSAGTLQIGSAGTSGAVSQNIVDNAAVVFNRTDTSTYAGAITGTGSVTQAGTGTTILTGNNTYSGATTISAGTLQIGNGGTSGSLAGNIANNSALVFNRSDTSTYAGAISGTGTVTQAGAGTTVLTGSNSYSGTTTISSGTLQIGNGGTSGSLGSGAVTDNASLVFDRSDSVTYNGAITGTGSLTQAGAGTTILTGSGNNYSGGTTIAAGTLQLGNNTAGGAITGNVTDNGTLAFDLSNSNTFNGQITGSGGVTQMSGQTTLTAAEGYTGATVVNGGTLLVNGSIADSSGVTVNSGGTIAGTGTVSKLTVNNNGTVTTGSGGIGTLTVAGNFILGPGATYSAQVTPAASNLLKVNGTATLEGALTVTPTGSGFSSTPIEILQSSGLSGKFSSITVFGTPSEIPIVSYTSDDVLLAFAPSVTSLLPSSSADTNQARVGSAIDFALEHDNALAFETVTGESGTALTQTLSELSGETAVAFQNVAVSAVGSFMSTLFDPSIGGRGGLSSGADGITDAKVLEQVAFNGPNSDIPYQRPSLRAVTVWSNFYGYDSTTDGNTSLGTHRTTATQYGGTVGLDYRPKSGDGAIGIAVGMSGNSWNLAEQLGTGEATAYQIGTYYSRRFANTYITAGLSYARYSVSTDRTVNLGGENLYHADFVSNSIAARAESGHTFYTDIGLLTPFARFQAADIGVPHYAEQTEAGSSSYALSYTGKQHYDYSSEAGFSWNTLIGQLTDLHARLGWLHDYSGGLNDTATFSSFNGASFTVDGAAPPRDAGHFVLGIDHNVNNVVFTLNAETAIAGNATIYGGTAAIAYRW